MSDPVIVIACASTCIAILSAFMSWNALRHSSLTWGSHRQLHKEFWRQSLVQSDQNKRVWRTLAVTHEQLAFILNHLSLPAPPTSDKPPNIPLN